VFTSALDVAQTETKGTVLIKNAEEMLNFTSGEEKHMEKVRFYLFIDSWCLRHELFIRSSRKLLILASTSSLLVLLSVNLLCIT